MNQLNEQKGAPADASEISFDSLGRTKINRAAAELRGGRRPQERGRTAVWQARLVMLVMINIAQLWILSATLEAALAGHFSKLLPLVISSGVCWLIALSIFLWWKPASRRKRISKIQAEQ